MSISRRGLRRHPRRDARGVALLITLFCVALVSILIVGFLAESTLSRQISFSSAGQTRAQILCLAAANSIIGDFKDEIAAGSQVTTQQGTSLYYPTTNFTAVPYRNTDATLGVLFRTSQASTNLWYGTYYANAGPIRSSTSVLTTDAAVNGRSISLSRWNKPCFFASLPAAFAAPAWFLLTRQGPIAGTDPALAQLADATPSNNNYVIGRYAYAVYDEGDLLDITVAGNGLQPSDNAKRGRLVQADLSQIPGVLSTNAFLTWRSPTTLSATNWIFASTNAFLTNASADQTFVSRQDLIKYSQDNPSVLSSSALPYLTTFSREKNAPSYSPTSPASPNFNLATLRGTDGTLQLKQRFPLSRLALVTYAVTADTSSDIYKYFGITRSDAGQAWVYNHGSASQIETLDTVAAAGRDPDFFELLKAAILTGSLGKTAGDPANTSRDTVFLRAAADSDLDLQILSIGANIIDQYDTDSYPTSISITDSGTTPPTVRTVHGIENLPYINRVFNTPYLKSGNSLTGWNEFEMWNPHQNPSSSFTASAPGPAQFRIVGKGNAYTELSVIYPAGTTTLTDSPSAPVDAHWVQFSLQAFNEPTLLSTTSASCDFPSGGTIVGLYTGAVAVNTNGPPSWTTINGTSGCSVNGSVRPDPVTFLTFDLQFQDSLGNWITYQELPNQHISSSSGSGASPFFLPGPNRGFYFHSDPRNVRFGGGYNGGVPPGTSMRPSGDGTFTSGCPVAPLSNNQPPPGWHVINAPANPLHTYLGDLANNSSTYSASGSYYQDFDGVLRLGDCGLDNTLNPLLSGSTAPRPIVLNRPFRSVGELGYAFRDQPWKTLDFFTTNSADAGLLDVFTVDDAPVVAGKVDLNTQQVPVLQALLSGAAPDEYNNVAPLNSTQAGQLAQDLTNFTSSKGPFLNKAELVTRYSSTLVNTTATFYPGIKTQREGLIRALAQAGNTRTWNFMIDVIAQAGHFPPNARSEKDFVVEGERHYWIHVAIDRFTREIVDEQMETVYE